MCACLKTSTSKQPCLAQERFCFFANWWIVDQEQHVRNPSYSTWQTYTFSPLYTLFLIHGHPFEKRLNRRLVSSSADRPLPQTGQVGSPFQTILFMWNQPRMTLKPTNGLLVFALLGTCRIFSSLVFAGKPVQFLNLEVYHAFTSFTTSSPQTHTGRI